MIRCDIVKGKTSQNLVQQGWDAQPRNADGFVLDLGNIGYRGSNPAGQYPEIRGQGYVEPDPISVGGGPPQSRIFRNTQQLPQNQGDLGYSFQNINGQYINTGKK